MVKKDIENFYFVDDLKELKRKNCVAIEKETRILYIVDIRENDIITLPKAEGLIFANKKDIEIGSVISDVSETFFKILSEFLKCDFIVDDNKIDIILKFDNVFKKYRFIRESGNCLGYFADQSDVKLFVFTKEDDTPKKICYRFQFEFFYQVEGELNLKKEQINLIENRMKKTLLKYN